MNGSTPDQRETPVRPAATVVPLRDSERGLELLITVRPKSMRFMGGATVFPGGAVSDSDADPRWARASSLSPSEAARHLGETDESSALAFYVCALREAYEEVGLVAGTGPLERLIRESAESSDRFLAQCLENDITLGTDLLHPAGSFVTPLGSTVRFDARFFVMIAPAGWEPQPDPSEVAECRWTTAADALAEFADGKAVMAPPTVEMLQILQPHDDSGEALAALSDSRVGDGGSILRVPVAPLTELLLAPNPSMMTGPGTNTYVVGSGPRAVIDPATDDPEYIETVLDAAGEVSVILVTHRHPDHVGGIEKLVERTGATVRAFGSESAGGSAVEPIEDGEVIAIPGTTLTALHTPGHAADHLSFLMEDRWLFAGDNVLGEGTSVIAPPEGSMEDFLESLRRLRELPIENLLTGHFRPLDDAHSVLDGLIAHRLEREEKIMRALGRESVPLDRIVAGAYDDTPESLHPIAVHSALAHLQKLAADGRAEELPQGWRLKVVR